jgi:hypothetical protein
MYVGVIKRGCSMTLSYRSAPLGVYEGVLSFCPLRNAHITLLESLANNDTVL